jgi:hypothetical protein
VLTRSLHVRLIRPRRHVCGASIVGDGLGSISEDTMQVIEDGKTHVF